MLPIVPDDPVGPFCGLNLREVWLIAIMLAGISFVGYAAVKYFGAKRGLLLAGAAGGLASSTAVTVTNARHAAAGEGSPHLLAAGVALANAMMLVRVGVIVAAVNASLLWLVAPTLAAASVTAAAIAGLWCLPATGRQKERRRTVPQSIRFLGGRRLCAVRWCRHCHRPGTWRMDGRDRRDHRSRHRRSGRC